MTMTPKGQIDRTGKVHFGEASISISEEGLIVARNAGGRAGEKAWELQFKRQVFARIVQCLRRLGWTVQMPPIKEHDVKHYGGNVARWAAERHRECFKGDLKGELEVSGRTITFEMWQSVNTPTRPDHGGRYEHNKEACMPYVLRLEMERTRRRIRDYLCNVFSGYTFETKVRSIYRKPLQETAMERIAEHYAESWHFKGDMAAYLKKNGYESLPEYNCKSNDGKRIEHGQHVYFKDWHGRICSGTALYNINNMWWVVTGKYDYTNVACFDIFTKCPDNPRVKRNQRQARKRLENLMQDAIKAMDFKRAQVLKDIIFPTGPLYAIWSKRNNCYFDIMYCGYRSELTDAGKYTRAELKPYLGDKLEDANYKAVPVE